MAELEALVGETMQVAEIEVVEPREAGAYDVVARRESLAAHGIVAPPWFRGAGFGEDDLLDACAAAWTAVAGRSQELT